MSKGKTSSSLEPVWEAVAITVSRIEGMHGQPSWRCRTCGLVLGGSPVKKPLDACPICASARGELVAVLVRGGETPHVSTFVVDEQFQQLVDSYRAAKDATATDEEDRAVVSTRGSYDVDGDMSTPFSDANHSEEHRLALALADATLMRSPASSVRHSESIH